MSQWCAGAGLVWSAAAVRGGLRTLGAAANAVSLLAAHDMRRRCEQLRSGVHGRQESETDPD